MPAMTVLYFFGWVFALLAGAMLWPLFYALAVGEPREVQTAFLVTILALIFVAGAIMIALRGRLEGRNRRAGLLTLGAIWVFVPVAAAVPFYLSGEFSDFYGAYFEAVSGFTTTGATVLPKLDEVPKSVILWRAQLQWMGGAATYFALALILGPLSGRNRLDWELQLIGGNKFTFAEQLAEAFRVIMPIYSGFTLACFLALWGSGVEPFQAICFAMATVSTGGFAPRDGEVIRVGSAMTEFVLGVFMLLGAVSLIWLRGLMRWQWQSVRAALEPFWIMAAVLGLTLYFLVMKWQRFVSETGLGLWHEFTTAFASAASIISTTGFIIHEPEIKVLPYLALLVLCVIGGGRFSTAGGLKFFRVAAMFRQSWRELKILIFPHGVRPNRFGNESEDMELMKSVWATFAVVITSTWVLAVFLSATMTPEPSEDVRMLAGAFMASASAISNIGPAYNMLQVTDPGVYPSFAEFTPLAKLAYCIGMILGRVEILALLSLINLSYWRS